MISGSFGDVSPELEEIFVRVRKGGAGNKNFNRLIQRRVEMIPPAELDDSNLHAKLQEVLQTLAEMRCFLHDTDHLSDRELYAWLWTDGLREETPDMAQLGGAWHTSPIGSCTQEHIAVHLDVLCEQERTTRLEERISKRPFAAALSVALQPGRGIYRGRSGPLSDCPPRE